MYAYVAILFACLHAVMANYRTCNCDIRIEDEANAPKLISWTTRLWSCGLFCTRFPGVHASCDEVTSWCPNKCHTMAKQKLNSYADLDAMCAKHGKEVDKANGIHLYAYSKVMNNCGGHWDHFDLKFKLCCARFRRRLIGDRC